VEWTDSADGAPRRVRQLGIPGDLDDNGCNISNAVFAGQAKLWHVTHLLQTAVLKYVYSWAVSDKDAAPVGCDAAVELGW